MTTIDVTTRPTVVVPGKLYSAGGMITLDGRLSWAPANARGWQPAHTYVRLLDDRALVIDPGLAAFQDDVVAGLASLLPSGMEVEVLFSRARHDCIGNLGALVEAFDVTRIYTGGVLNPFDAFSAAPLIDTRSRRTAVLRSPDESHLEILHPALRILTTFWSYDPELKTIFTSDAFTHAITLTVNARPLIATTRRRSRRFVALSTRPSPGCGAPSPNRSSRICSV